MPDSSFHASLEVWMKAVQGTVEATLEALLPPASETPGGLHESMRYAVLGGGKRIRPLLVFAAGELVGASERALSHAAAAVELIHAYSLVHDDMPCMDNDVLRRGKPTVHVKFGEAGALLAGDALQTLAFEALTEADAGAEATVAMVARLARASGSRGMAGGQAIDLASVGRALDRPALEEMHRLKTGALLRASVILGALAGGGGGTGVLEQLETYAGAVGLAFQVVDDILDVESDTAVLGKTAGKDAEANKPTYVSLLGLNASKALAAELRQDAHAALKPLGPQARRLAELADLIVLRRN